MAILSRETGTGRENLSVSLGDRKPTAMLKQGIEPGTHREARVLNIEQAGQGVSIVLAYMLDRFLKLGVPIHAMILLVGYHLRQLYSFFYLIINQPNKLHISHTPGMNLISPYFKH